MPTYSFKCEECGNDTVKMCRIADRDRQYCSCGATLKRKIDAPGSVWSPTRNGGHS